MYNSKGCGCGNHSQCSTDTECECDIGSVTLVPCNVPTPPPTITVENLIELIDAKCDKEVCKVLRFEIDYLYWLMQQESPNGGNSGLPKCPDGTYKCYTPCADGTWDCYPDNSPLQLNLTIYQLISNMVDKLDGDLTDKYPSAALLKKELLALWRCLNDKHTHHGDWVDNFTWRNVTQIEDDSCLLDGSNDPAPDKIKVITPVDVGDTVFHTIDGRRCLFESLVDNNTEEPSKLGVLEGKWLNYCDIIDAINCVLPRKVITDCHENCDDPNHDGVWEGEPICECVICDVEDTNTVDLTKTPNPDSMGNTLKADVKISGDSRNIITVKDDGLLAYQKTTEDDFIENESGVPITYCDNIQAFERIKKANYHYTGDYPADCKLTVDWLLSSGLAPVDPEDNTATKWFALGVMGHDPVPDALAMISGVMSGNEDGLFERPVAYNDNHSKATIEFVILRNFTSDINQLEPLGNPVSPYATVHEYVKDKISVIRANGWDTDTGTKILALPKNWDWQTNVSSQPIKSVYFDPNPWISRYEVPVAMLYCRFKNESAISLPAPGIPTAPGYTPGQMTPQPITQYNRDAYVQYMGGIYKYLKVLKKLS